MLAQYASPVPGCVIPEGLEELKALEGECARLVWRAFNKVSLAEEAIVGKLGCSDAEVAAIEQCESGIREVGDRWFMFRVVALQVLCCRPEGAVRWWSSAVPRQFGLFG